MEEFKEEWESVSKIVVIAREGTPAFLFDSWRLTFVSRKYGKGKAVGGRAADLVRPTNCRVHLRIGTYQGKLVYSTDAYFL